MTMRRTAATRSILALAILAGLAAGAWAERFYPPWLLKQGPPPTYPHLIVDADYVAERYGRDGTELISLVDLTPAQADTLARRHGGDLNRLLSLRGTRWRDGHIPHSLPLDPTLLLAPDGGIPPGPDLRDSLEGLGPRPATTVDVYAEFILCGGRLASTRCVFTPAASWSGAATPRGRWCA